MRQDHKDILINSIKEMFSVQGQFSEFEVNSNFQSLVSQLDLFKVMAGLVIGVIGIGYLYNQNLDENFLLTSLFFAVLTLVMSISYTREVIDLQPKENERTHKLINEKVKEHNDKVLEALKADDSEIFFSYARSESSKNHPKPPLNYTGEIVIFFFYLSVGLLGLSFVAPRFSIGIMSIPTLVLLVIIYGISFKDWAIKLSNLLSSPLNQLNK